MHLSAFDGFLWGTGVSCQAVLLAVLFFRNRAKEFPIFTALVGWSFSGAIVLYFLHRYAGPWTYYYGYWIAGTVDMLMQVAVVCEVASHVFAPLGRWAPDVRHSFIKLAGGSIVFALVLAMLQSPDRSTFMETVIARGTLFSAVLMSELFVGLVAVSATAGLPWKTHVARITQALGAYSILCVMLDTSTTWMAWPHQAHAMHAVSQVRILAYNIALIYWSVMLWRNAPAPRELPDSMRMQIFQLHRQIEYDLGRIRGWRKI